MKALLFTCVISILWFYHRVMHQKDVYGLANSVDPDLGLQSLSRSVVVVLVFYGPLTHFRSFRSFNLTTLFLGKPSRLTVPVLSAYSFASN